MRRTALTMLALCAFASLAGCKDDSPSGPATPAEDASTDAPTRSYDFASFEEYLFNGSWKSEGTVVLHEGQQVYEKYAAGYDANKRHLTYSVSKSVGSALVGIAIAEGLLKLEDSICKHVPAPEGSDPTLCDTTIEHLLQMRSGLKWTEDYADPATSNVLPMLYGDEADMGLYVALRTRAAKAGEAWSYSSGDSNLLARALRSALGGKDMRAWAKEKLFDPAGLSSMIFETDRSGTLVFSSSAFITPRDMAKFGQLYLDDGMKGATRVLPPNWVTYTKTPAPPVATPAPGRGSYGAAFWLNAAAPSAPKDTFSYPQAPADTYSAEGHWGQLIVIVPSKKLVIVRTGNDREPTFDAGPMIERAAAAIDKATGGNP